MLYRRYEPLLGPVWSQRLGRFAALKGLELPVLWRRPHTEQSLGLDMGDNIPTLLSLALWLATMDWHSSWIYRMPCQSPGTKHMSPENLLSPETYFPNQPSRPPLSGAINGYQRLGRSSPNSLRWRHDAGGGLVRVSWSYICKVLRVEALHRRTISGGLPDAYKSPQLTTYHC